MQYENDVLRGIYKGIFSSFGQGQQGKVFSQLNHVWERSREGVQPPVGRGAGVGQACVIYS